jgi:dTMP kinase
MFITFEGIDGSGKSTQARLLETALHDRGYSPLLLREPGGTPVSEEIRELLLDAGQEITPLAELLLFSAARAQLVERRIRPALEQNKPVLCDRFYDSTTAYQGAGRKVADIAWIEELNIRVTSGLKPVRTYYFEVPIEVALDRVRGSDMPADRMEASGAEFYRHVAEAYRKIAAEEPNRVVMVDGTMSPENIHRYVWEDICSNVLSGDGTHCS